MGRNVRVVLYFMIDGYSGSRQIENRGYDLKAVNPNAKQEKDMRTPAELPDLIEAKGREVDTAVAELRKLLAS